MDIVIKAKNSRQLPKIFTNTDLQFDSISAVGVN
jgi:hypothetical protein